MLVPYQLSDKIRLIKLSFLMLFIELTLIRWIGSNIFFLSFFTNFILLASFLGMGAAFLRPNSATPLFPFSPLMLALLILFCYYFRYQYAIHLDPNTNDLIYSGSYFKDNFLPIEITLPFIFLFVTVTMVAVADGVKNEFKKFASLQAYRLEVTGALLGVMTFLIVSFLHTSPIIWGGIIFFMFVLLLANTWRFNRPLSYLQILSLMIMIGVFSNESLNTINLWSPYYKIGIQPYSNGRLAVTVNGVLQQFIESVEQRKKFKPFYFIPYQHMAQTKKLDNVLIVGAGTGGDVAIALAEGAKHIDAIEIDPLLYQLGKKLHPDKPYDDPRVTIFIDDGRSFLQKNNTLYDMIIFALPDSIMLIPGQASLRLENYLFTLEGIMQVYHHLETDGVFTMYSYYHSRRLVDRLANTMATVFQHSPCLDSFGADNLWLSVLTISQASSSLQCSRLWNNVFYQYSTPATDNHPFVFLTEKSISLLYIITLFFILFTSLGVIKIAGGNYRSIIHYADLFLMGAAFLLLETKSIVNFALFFGSTWLVNALVFIGILFTVYLAIELTYRRMSLSPFILYLILAMTL